MESSDGHDTTVMAAGIALSNALAGFLGETGTTLSRLTDAGVIDRGLLNGLREAQRRMLDARVARVGAAR
jgi:hypothetical protein